MSDVSRFSICLVRTNIFRGFLATRRINIGIPSFLDRSRIPSGKRNSHWESSKVNLICSVNFRSHRFPPNAEMNIWRSSIFAKAATKRWNTFHTSVHYTSLKLNTRKKKKRRKKRKIARTNHWRVGVRPFEDRINPYEIYLFSRVDKNRCNFLKLK